ncbi:hypothetical protein GLOIN_2v1880134 [Rhizophagus irregularis DAOM 181602=DAOM 197198]|uniref:Uncharacterized protein n=1 Tax=Rhizophagus irregularis (strain DAOM 181602 / DAOM 197198 / MUCL 43194) TaxID=747089 RepID=A0A2P4PL27_RHIID|nr:hypothetical protein GLOIN_2v1880134 [Rhizophagus irregularis DAOM 181602=DAOM 197198]POG66057.1 hypothetical protein GLOIN_2v1880134 [Rhizophagus irregularis DAOM 181602=DAOM 197198]|eukprot:XP_025172923.1 hypothetical protein GLOIN_2v1880134 [Rhizophagus irregularis DAOM 181602=DAOM 197198]
MVSKTEYIINITSVFTSAMPTRLSLDLHGRQGETKVQGRRPTWYHDKHVKIEMIRLSPTQTPLVAATVWILNSYVLVHGEDQLVRKSFIRVASENKSVRERGEREEKGEQEKREEREGKGMRRDGLEVSSLPLNRVWEGWANLCGIDESKIYFNWIAFDNVIDKVIEMLMSSSNNKLHVSFSSIDDQFPASNG